MDTDTTETNPEENQSPKQLGDLLKSYRENANMDISQAADTLCLTEGTVRLLENEEFDKLPEAPYLRGYLRGYAKLANVNSAEVIALYESMRDGSSVASDTQYNFTPSSSVDDYIKPLIPPHLVQLGAFAAILLLFAIIYMIPGVKQWTNNIWDEFSQQNVVAEQENSEATPKQIEQASLNVASMTAAQEQSSTTPSANSTQKTENTSDANVKNPIMDKKNSAENMEGTIKRQATDNNANTTSENGNTENVASKKQENTDSEKAAQDKKTTDTKTLAENTATTTETNNTETSNTIDPNAQAPTAPAAAETTPVDMAEVDATAGEVMVKLVFKDEVWMRVNSKKKKVFSGLKKSGDTEEFKATKPLSFKVGNSPGVDIYVNGKLYDQTPYMRGVVAKFKVDNI